TSMPVISRSRSGAGSRRWAAPERTVPATLKPGLSASRRSTALPSMPEAPSTSTRVGVAAVIEQAPCCALRYEPLRAAGRGSCVGLGHLSLLDLEAAEAVAQLARQLGRFEVLRV